MGKNERQAYLKAIRFHAKPTQGAKTRCVVVFIMTMKAHGQPVVATPAAVEGMFAELCKRVAGGR